MNLANARTPPSFQDDCLDYPGRSESCHHLSHGRRQTEDLSLELYRSVSQDGTVEQENFLIVPMELTRIVSVLIHGGDAEHEEKYAQSFEQASSHIPKSGGASRFPISPVRN